MKKRLTLLAISILMFGFTSFALAKSDNAEETTSGSTWKEKREEIREDHQEKVGEIKESAQERLKQIREKRCEKVEARIQKRIGVYENRDRTREQNFENMQKRLENIISRYKNAGYDVSEMEDATTTFIQMVTDLKSIHTGFIDKLKTAEQYTCGESEGVFLEKLKASRDLLKKTKEMINDVREYYQNTIRKEILKLRDQAKNNGLEDLE